MRHGKKVNKLGRTHSHRAALLSNMAASLLMNKRITTTVAKAKALRVYVEPLITRSKADNTHSRRVVFSYLQNKFAVAELFREIAPKVSNRPGGYTRIIKTGNRLGDNAEMCMMELVDFNELLLGTKDSKKAKTTRRGRKKAATTKTEAASADVATEAGETEASTDEAAEAPKKAKRSTKKKSEDK